MKSLIPALACSFLVAPSLADVVREGAGDRRARLNAMERKSFDTGLLSQLSDWSSESAITAGDTSGKVVLLVTWASWYTPSHQVLALAQQLADKHGSDLRVIGIHHPKGYASAQALAKARGVRFPIAHDADGRVREALLVDQDPDFFVIDRAGQLRFADITTGSVTEAVQTLIAESRDDAATLNQRIDDERRRADAAFRATGGINQEVDLRSLPEIPFTPPSAGEWAAIDKDDWPEKDDDDRRRRRGDDEERSLPIPEGAQVLPKPVPLNGRARVVYFWHPDLLWTYERSMLEAERIQKLKGRDVAVIGVLTPREERRGRGEDDEANSPERLTRVLRDTVRKVDITHGLMLNLSSEMFTAASGGDRRNGFDIDEGSIGPDGWFGAPVAVVSSDGVIRWYGLMSDPRFESSLNKVLRIDPGVKARRAAEAEYIRTQGR